jgi:hypothetical protein
MRWYVGGAEGVNSKAEADIVDTDSGTSLKIDALT